jgi:hypothetical protein
MQKSSAQMRGRDKKKGDRSIFGIGVPFGRGFKASFLDGFFESVFGCASTVFWEIPSSQVIHSTANLSPATVNR